MKSNSPTETEQKKHRLINNFSANRTASLALGKDAKKKNANTAYSFASIINALTSIAFKPVATIVNHANETDVKTQMESLESQVKNVSDPDDILLQKVTLVEDNIVEHAARRVDLFFYLLIAVYGTHATVTKDETVKQHGRGAAKRGTQACHSSLFPSLKFIYENAPAAKSFSLWSLLTTETVTPQRDLSGTHLAEAMNMTVELPAIVNAFDGHLEGRSQPTVYTQECLATLNRVAKAEIDPIAGMNEFFKIMNAFFSHIEYEFLKKPGKVDSPNAFRKVWEYEKAGTFQAACKDTLIMDDHYLTLMLRLSTFEIAQSKLYAGSMTRFYKRIQDEIYSSKPVNAHDHTGRNPSL